MRGIHYGCGGVLYPAIHHERSGVAATGSEDAKNAENAENAAAAAAVMDVPAWCLAWLGKFIPSLLV